MKYIKFIIAYTYIHTFNSSLFLAFVYLGSALTFVILSQIDCWNKPHNAGMFMNIRWYAWVFLTVAIVCYFWGRNRLKKEKNE